MPPLYPHQDLKDLVCDTFQIQDVFAKSRRTDYVVARSLYFYLLRKNNYSYTRLSRLARMNHTSIMHSIKRFNEYYAYYLEYRSMIDYIISEWAANKCNQD